MATWRDAQTEEAQQLDEAESAHNLVVAAAAAHGRLSADEIDAALGLAR